MALLFTLNSNNSTSATDGALFEDTNMRKIEENMRHAVRHGRDWKSCNTAVVWHHIQKKAAVYLHGNHIADYWHETGQLEVDARTLVRWPTPTTKSRLRALGANVETRKGKTYLDGVEV